MAQWIVHVARLLSVGGVSVRVCAYEAMNGDDILKIGA